MKVIAVAAAVAVALAIGAAAQECELVEDWKIETGLYNVADFYVNGPSFGVWTDSFEHKEYMWVHHNTDIDFYDLTSSAGLGADGNPVLAYTLPSGSTCSQAMTFAMGDHLITYHGDEAFCTCAWSDTNRCPSAVEFKIGDGEPFQVELGPNSVSPVALISPDVTAGVGLAFDSDPTNPNFGCIQPEPRGPDGVTGLVNPEDVAGKYCAVDRGGCLFQWKYWNCLSAGAIGVIIMNRNPQVINMPVFEVDPGTPFVMVTDFDGQTIKDNVDDIQITIGRGTGPAAPVEGYTEPDAMGSINPWTGENVITSAPFLLANDVVVDYRRNLMYAFQIDGNVPAEAMVLDMEGPVDGAYPALGTFPQGAAGTYWDIIYPEDGGVFLTETNWVQNYINVYDATADPASPELVTTIDYDDSWCPGTGLGGVEVHPSQKYIYVAGRGLSDDCGAQVNAIYDVTDPSMPVRVGDMVVPEMEPGSGYVQVNGLKWAWGPNDVGATPMSSTGLAFYDFSDPLNPTLLAPIYKPYDNMDDFTTGMYATVYGDNGYWIAYERDSIDGVHGIWHALKLVCPE